MKNVTKPFLILGLLLGTGWKCVYTRSPFFFSSFFQTNFRKVSSPAYVSSLFPSAFYEFFFIFYKGRKLVDVQFFFFFAGVYFKTILQRFVCVCLFAFLYLKTFLAAPTICLSYLIIPDFVVFKINTSMMCLLLAQDIVLHAVDFFR